VKLLFDQNLSPRLCDTLRNLWPDLVHVRHVGLSSADDNVVWEYAARQGFTIVSKDSDFNNLSFLLGAPPKVIWLRAGNCSTSEIEKLIRGQEREIVAFVSDPDSTLLVVSL